MLGWGAAWGAVLGLATAGADALIPGLVLGLAAAWSLRRAVRKEVDRRIAAYGVVPQAAPVPPAGVALRDAAGAAASPVPAGVDAAVGVDATAEDGAAASGPMPAEPLPAALAAAAAQSASGRVPVAPHEDAPAAAASSRRAARLPAWGAAVRGWLLGGNTVVRLGAVVLFMGLAFLARYAAEHALLPPALRVAAIGAAGIALLAGGFRIARRSDAGPGGRAAYGLTLQGAGVAVLYLTLFAAYRLYGLIPAGGAFALMVAVCALSTVVSLRQDARALAALGLAGGFFAPVLASAGMGSHVALFAYFALLDAAMLAIVARRAWRELALLAFVCTFGIATAWGVLQYRPALLASVQPFLALYLLIFIAAAVLQARRGVVDSTLAFGTPLVAFGLQAALVRDTGHGLALSALAFAAVYVLLGSALARRAASWRLLAESFIAIGLGFATLAVPLALDARWTAGVWALEGAGAFWVGQRQGRWTGRAAGSLLQLAAAMAFVASPPPLQARWPLAHPAFIGALLLALPALWIAFRIGTAPRPDAAGAGSGRAARAWVEIERRLEPVLFLVGLGWWLLAFALELQRSLPGGDATVHAWPPAWRTALMMLACVATAAAGARLARRLRWSLARWPAYATLPVMLAFALAGLGAELERGAGLSPLSLPGLVAWPACIALHASALRAVDRYPPQGWFRLVHGAHLWLGAALACHALIAAARLAGLQATAWPGAALLLGLALTMLIATRIARGGDQAPWRRWPLDRFARDYAWIGGAPVAAVTLACAAGFASVSPGASAPLPWLPLLNPTDLSVALALAACAIWIVRIRGGGFAVPAAMRQGAPWIALGAVAFLAVDTAWLRAAHHLAGVPWQAGALFESPLVQAGYAILWTLSALVLMGAAHRRQARALWMTGAALLALTVAKLFLIDLSNAGSTGRIVAFIGVGLAMLLVGWIAPLPPVRNGATEAAR